MLPAYLDPEPNIAIPSPLVPSDLTNQRDSALLAEGLLVKNVRHGGRTGGDQQEPSDADPRTPSLLQLYSIVEVHAGKMWIFQERRREIGRRQGMKHLL
jgi:hypothetical protein